MSLKLFIQRFLLTCIILFLLWLAREELAGGVQQFTRSNTFGRQVETIIQLGCGLLSLLTVSTCFWWQKWAPSIRIAWAISVVLVAGLSSLVWGPPMPIIALVFAAVALLLSMGILWGLRRLTACVRKAVEQTDKTVSRSINTE